MSNAFDRFDGAPDAASLVVAEAKRQGVDPELALRVAHRESSMNPLARSPKGAVGVMQLMPGTAADLGVDPHDPEQNIRGGVTYLKRQIDHFGDPTLAAAAYNAGPGAVEKAGGVPNFPETKAYVAATAPQAGNPFDQFDAPAAPAPAPPAVAQANPARVPPVLTSHNGGVTIGIEPKAKPSALKDIATQFPLGAKQGGAQIADMIASIGPAGFLGRMSTGNPFGLANPMNAIGDLITRTTTAHDPAPKTKAGEYAKTVGQMLPNALAPGSVPQRIASVVLPGVASQGAGDIAQHFGASPGGVQAARVLGGMAGGAASGIRLNRAPKPAMASLEDLDKAQQSAWTAVDASTYRFPQADVKSAASDITAMVKDAGPDLYENSAKVAAKVQRMADAGELTPGQANRLRSQIREKLMTPGSTEVSVGGDILKRLNQLIDSSAEASPLLKDATSKYAQFMKYKDVSQRLEDAGINQSASGTGGNPNAARQALKPLVKNKSTQRMRGATPDEMAALKNVVNGTPVQNGLRAMSAFDPFHSRLGMLLQGLGIAHTGGASLATVPIGLAGTAGERALGRSNIDKVLATIANGGKKPVAPAALTYQPGELLNLPLISLLSASQSTAAPVSPPRR